ncbi:FAT4 [Mytilus edulis]|uniref:FAT4 n=1 Tax=Mytilus edulis TaxID=6550 RepID=A0A8S3RL53_MYTED|nr:FAT4 [Mytilus edulis]
MYIKNSILLTVIILLRKLCVVSAADECTTNGETGENNGLDSKKENDDIAGTVVVLTQFQEFRYPCCGFVYEWKFHTRATGTFDALVWRHQGNEVYLLVGSNSLTSTSERPDMSGVGTLTLYNDEVSVGDVLATITTTDNDPEDVGSLTLTLESASNSGSSYFEFVSDEIRVKALPPVNTYNLVLKVEDPCTLSRTGTEIIDILNRLPVINNLPDSVSISEDTADNTLIFTINATDTVTVPVQCKKIGGGTVPFSVLQIPGSTDYGVYKDAGAFLNYDITQSYKVTVECDDLDDKVDADLTINLIQNQAPVIQSLPDSVSFLEDWNTNTLLHTLTVTDAESDIITCTLNPTSTIYDVSLIPPSNTGYGIYLTGGTTLDYDTTSSYTLSVRCNDVRRSDTESFTVNLIRNTPPVINSLPTTESISEDLNTRTLVHALNVTDVNAADTVTCAINPNNALFELSKIPPASVDYGVFLVGGTVLDYDVTPSYTLNIDCADHRRSVSDVLTVAIIRNEPPTIVNLPMSSDIPESITSESLLYTISVTDPTNDTVTCVITPATSIFYLQTTSAQFETEIWVRGNQGFVYDTKRQYTLNIECADQRRSDSDAFYVYILRNMPPYFTNLQDKTSVSSETSAAGQIIYTVDSVDPESDNVQYSLSSNTANAPFIINQNTGAISFTRSVKTELVAGYDLYISVSDGRNVVAARSLSVRITGINFPPHFQVPAQTLTVLENINTGSAIFQPTITDEDLSDVHTFSVVYSPPDGAVYFGVDKSTGLITSLVDIDYETIPFKSFLLVITGSDSLLEDTTNITLNVQNVNEAPVFTKKYYSITTSENSGGTMIQNPYYQYTDVDGDTLKFSLDCGANTGRLDIDSSTGLLSFSTDYDLDIVGTASKIDCKVSITDDEYTDMAYVNITILDDNDNSPVFIYSEYTFYIPVTSSVGSFVGQVQAIDKDIGNYGNVFYHIALEDFNYGLFDVVQDGSIFVSESLTQYTEGSTLNLTIYGVDPGAREGLTMVYVVFPTTYVAPITPGDGIEYLTFFRYSPNMAWFVPLMFILFATFCVAVHTLYKSNCSCLKKKERSMRKKKRKRPMKSFQRY